MYGMMIELNGIGLYDDRVEWYMTVCIIELRGIRLYDDRVEWYRTV